MSYLNELSLYCLLTLYFCIFSLLYYFSLQSVIQSVMGKNRSADLTLAAALDMGVLHNTYIDRFDWL